MNYPRTMAGLLSLFMAGSSLFAKAPILPPPVSTGTFEARTQHREVRQQRRIAQGVRSGALTPRETAHLERQEARIDRNIGKAEADGQITPGEARKINHAQNAESRRIYRKKHNARRIP